MFPAGYNNAYQIIQIPGYVVIASEMIHDTRIIPLDGRPHVGSDIRLWNGDSRGRFEGKPNALTASMFGSIIPAAWSFMLAARSRGLGTVWTTFHLVHEEEVARILGIPYDEVTQVALIPVAYTIGTEFKPGKRKPLDTMLHWERW